MRNAETYYRAMFRGGAESWNVRDRHMMTTLEALLAHAVRSSEPARAVVWAHNSHLGDARATSMADITRQESDMRAPVTMQEVSSAEWRSFLERFGGAHRAWLGTMHWVPGHGNVTTERVALESIGVDDHLSGKIVRLCFLEGPSIRVERPRAVRIERNDRGAEGALEIETAAGGLFRLAIRATALSEELDGLAPGEVWPERSLAIAESGCDRATRESRRDR